MRQATQSARHDDRGFTLAELVISIMILGFIVGAIGMTMSVGLRTASSAADRISSTRAAHTLAAFLPADLEALSPDGGLDTTPNAATTCPGSDPGANVLTITPRGHAIVSYRLVGDIAPMQLVRVACADGSRSANVVVDGLSGPGDIAIDPSQLSAQLSLSKVTMIVTTHDGGSSTTFAVSGTPRATSASTTACTVNSIVPGALTINGFGHLAADTAVTVVTNGPCDTLAATVMAAGNDVTTIVLTTKARRSTTWTGTLSAALTWTPGAKTINVAASGATIAGSPLAVVQPCALMSAVSPTGALIDGFGRLTADTALAFTSAGSCGTMTLRIATGGAPPTLTIPVTAGSSAGAWTSAPMHAADATWSLAPHAVTVLSDGVVAGTTTFAATPQPCSVVTPPSGPTSVLFDATLRLTANATFAFTTAGVCTGLTFAGSTGGTPTVLTVVAAGGPAAWTATLRPGDATWAAGTATFTLANTGTPLATATLTIAPQPCSAGVPALSPTALRIDTTGALIAPATFTARTAGVCGPLALSIVTGDQPGADPLSLPLTGGPTTWTAQVRPTDASWTAGTRAVSVVNAGTTIATANVAVTVACSLVSATPTEVQLNAAKQLFTPTSITVTTTGTCGSPSLSFTTGPGAGTSNQNVPLTASGANTWTGNLNVNATWTTGTKTVTLTDAGYNGGTFALVAVMAPPCVLVDLAPAKWTANPTPIVVTTTGACGPSMSVSFTPPVSFARPTTVALTAGTPGPAGATWTANVATTQWQKSRPIAVTVLNNGVSIGQRSVSS